MATTLTRELGYKILSPKALRAGCTTSITIEFRIADTLDSATRTLTGVANVDSREGPFETDDPEWKQVVIRVTPTGASEKHTVTFRYDNGPETVIDLPVQIPTVISIEPNEVSTGMSDFVIKGKYLTGFEPKITQTDPCVGNNIKLWKVAEFNDKLELCVECDKPTIVTFDLVKNNSSGTIPGNQIQILQAKPRAKKRGHGGKLITLAAIAFLALFIAFWAVNTHQQADKGANCVQSK